MKNLLSTDQVKYIQKDILTSIILFNRFWTKPGDSLKPVNAEQVEGACYW